MKATAPPGGAAFLDGHLDEPHRHRLGQPRRDDRKAHSEERGEGGQNQRAGDDRAGGSRALKGLRPKTRHGYTRSSRRRLRRHARALTLLRRLPGHERGARRESRRRASTVHRVRRALRRLAGRLVRGEAVPGGWRTSADDPNVVHDRGEGVRAPGREGLRRGRVPAPALREQGARGCRAEGRGRPDLGVVRSPRSAVPLGGRDGQRALRAVAVLGSPARGFDVVCGSAYAHGASLLVLTHAPLRRIPPACVNVHGHLHAGRVKGSTAHVNVSVEQFDYRPRRLTDIRRLAAVLARGRSLPGQTTARWLDGIERRHGGS